MKVNGMTKIERFLATVERREVDRPASWLGLPTSEALPSLFKHFGEKDIVGLKRRIGDDVWPVEVPYRHPPANHIACAFDFANKNDGNYVERTLTAPGFFENAEDMSAVESFPWPDPANHMSAEACRCAVESSPPGYAVMGVMWSAHFQDACAAFGMETALMRLYDAPELFEGVIDRITAFYLDANKIFYDACGERLHAVLIGNDFGSQTSLMLAPELLRRFVFPGTRQLIKQAKSRGYKVIHHSCGAIRAIIPDLIDLGVDVIHPIQALATGMEPAQLKKDFGNAVSFCGGIDAQHLLVSGTPAAIRAKVEELRQMFPSGLVLSPSHEAILPDIPPANIAALFEAAQHT